MDSKFWGKIAISAVILGLVMVALQKMDAVGGITQLFLPPVSVSSQAEAMQQAVLLARSEVAVQEKGHLARASFALENRGDQDVKNIKIVCTLLDSSGSEQGRDTWLVSDTIKAHAHSAFSYTSKKYISNRAVASQCRIVDMEVVSAPLFAVHRATAQGSGAHDPHGAGTQHGGASH